MLIHKPLMHMLQTQKDGLSVHIRNVIEKTLDISEITLSVLLDKVSILLSRTQDTECYVVTSVNSFNIMSMNSLRYRQSVPIRRTLIRYNRCGKKAHDQRLICVKVMNLDVLRVIAINIYLMYTMYASRFQKTSNGKIKYWRFYLLVL
ncbi:hypothetical protein GJ496_011643 [Pomphorhynchus laevis]|nr:hypothetical protein GJ496_011643 [Pomphorhynchus laevis]